jgi:Mrp family chromosome partitioning ATPase
MGTPPQLSAEQRVAALAKAAVSRKRRADVKNQIKNGQLSIDDVLSLALTDEAIGKMRVKELLESLSGVGKIRVISLMERLNISPTRRIQGLGRHQLKELRNEFVKTDSAVKPGRLLVLSGPGGVGKSTVAANLALGLARQGAKVGIVDADIYGPSQHIMFGVENDAPGPGQFNGVSKMKPVESYGVKINSVGFLAGPNQAIALRGPMASKALSQLFYDTVWGELDYLIVDLPPGTGDIQISLCSQVKLTGAIVVCTPQPVAISDARKGIALFQLPAINVPVLGLVENMAWFTPEELPNNKYYIFGKDGVKQLSEEMNIPIYLIPYPDDNFPTKDEKKLVDRLKNYYTRIGFGPVSEDSLVWNNFE